MSSGNLPPRPSSQQGQASALGVATTASGAALLATAAGACCVPIIAPLIVAVLGASGAAWAAGLKPYSPYILGASLLLLLYGFWTVYRRQSACDVGEACSTTRASLAVRAVLWISALLWTGSLIVNVLFGV